MEVGGNPFLSLSLMKPDIKETPKLWNSAILLIILVFGKM